MQDAVHIYRMARGGTEERIVTGRRRDEMGHHAFAFAAHRDPRDHTRIVRRYFAIGLFRVLVHSLHLIGHYKNPIVKRAQETARVMESQVNHCARGAAQFVRPKREEVTVRFDRQIDNLLVALTQSDKKKIRAAHAKEKQRISKSRATARIALT